MEKDVMDQDVFVFPLSFAQERVWFLERLEPGRALYNMPEVTFRLQGPLDVAVLEQSLNEIVRRHETLRTTFGQVDGRPVQIIHPSQQLTLQVVPLDHLSPQEREAAARRIGAEEVLRSFDLLRGPLFRAVLLRLDAQDHVLVLPMHHIIFDGWSIGILLHELETLYAAFVTGEPSPLPELPIQYADYTEWQRETLQGPFLEQEVAYWRQQLAGAPPVLELPTDRPRPAVQTYRSKRWRVTLPQRLLDEVKTLSRAAGVTPFMTLLAAFQTLLYRYTGQEDIVVGTPIAGRNQSETQDLIGFFVNTLVLRTDLSDDPTFRQLLGRVRAVALGAYEHQELPFEKLVAELQPARHMSHSPLFQVLFALQNWPFVPPELPGLAVSPFELGAGTTMFDLALFLIEGEKGLTALFAYNTDLFEAATIERMAGHFQTLLQGIVAHPDQHIAALPILTTAERQHLLLDWNDIPLSYPAHQCIHQIFEAQAARTPDRVALVVADRQWTYDQLNRRANQLAHYLQKLGVGPETVVAICLERSLPMIVSILGILKAGAAYLPLDPAYPRERLAFMLEDTAAPLLLTQQSLLPRLPSLAPDRRVVCLNAEAAAIGQQPEENPLSAATAANLAYVLYTSGSTGQAKGVMVEHRNVVALLHGFEQTAPADGQIVGTSVCPYGFDVSVCEFFSALCFGGTLHMLSAEQFSTPEALADYLVAHRITSAYIPPALLAGVASHLAALDTPLPLRRLLVGVEPIKQETLQRFRRLSPQLRIVNGYGPTETTIWATFFPFHAAPEPERRTPIGAPVPGYQVYLLDAHLQPVPIGITGEILIGGAGVSRGYLHRPHLTAEKFIPNPFSSDPRDRLYRTGDMARHLPDGHLEFLGRLDHQVKVRGYRIELGEIEAALAQHPGAQEVVAVAREDTPGDRRLIAYVVPAQQPPPNVSELRRFLLEKLPEYMLPAAFVTLDELPLTAHGKVDRRALPPPEQTRPDLESAFLAPRTPAEHTLAAIWAELLGLEEVGIHDNFFELGGDSILSLQVVARANQAGLRLTPRQLFQAPTVAALAALAGTAPAVQAEQGLVQGPVPLTPIQRWFFEQELPEPHHWNQTLLLEVLQPLHPQDLEAAVAHLLRHHDALRLRFTREDTGWQQINAGLDGQPPVSVVDLSALPEAEQPTALAAQAAAAQASLKLATGPLLRLVYFHLGDGQPDRLLLAIHHLAVDGISWRVLLEDLQTALLQLRRGEEVTLPPKTTPFRRWTQRLTEVAQTDALDAELTYWLAAERFRVVPLPVDFPAGKAVNTMASAATVSASLDAEETAALLHDVPQAYNTQINDLLLTALVQTMARWTREPSLLIHLEGHGREELFEDVDLSRTVGWFTTMFPVLLTLQEGAGLGEALKSVKEQLRRIPQQGIGYGLLRYLRQEGAAPTQLAALPPAAVSFNYLGQLDQALARSSLFRPASESSGPPRSLLGQRAHLLEISGSVLQGTLQMNWTYSEQVHQRPTIERLAQGFQDALQALIIHCTSAEAGGYTPSDFPDVDLSQDELDDILATISLAGE